MNAIVAVDQNWGIGREGDLLVRLKGDLAEFRRRTLGQVVVMGRRTLESLPGGQPLAGRSNYVLSRDPDCRAACPVCRSPEEWLAGLGEIAPETVFVIGGAAIYRELLPYCDTAFVTKIEAVFPADCFFPNLDQDPAWRLVRVADPITENGLVYRFTEYRRIGAEPENGSDNE